MHYLFVVHKKLLTAQNETDTCALTHRKRIHVIDQTISLLSHFERMAIRYDNADVTRKCNSGLTGLVYVLLLNVNMCDFWKT